MPFSFPPDQRNRRGLYAVHARRPFWERVDRFETGWDRNPTWGVFIVALWRKVIRALRR